MSESDATSHPWVTRFPAEWERHSATWLSWPHNKDTWPNLKQAQQEFVAFAKTIAEVESVCILSQPAQTNSDPHRWLSSDPNIEFLDIRTNDAWIRDFGPTFVVESLDRSPSVTSEQLPICHRIAAVQWQYNGWGEKYPPFDDDQRVAQQILKTRGVPSFKSPIVLEGGAIDGNGAGLILTTTSCIPNQNRNPGFSQREENEILRRLGANQLLFVDPISIAGDDTDGHIDQIARFVTPKRLVVSENQSTTLKNTVDHFDFEILELPLPQTRIRYDRVLPASYCNFYFANDLLIVPQFDDPNDQIAVSILAEAVPDRTVIPLSSSELIVGLGSFHCLSQQQPSRPTVET